MVFANNLLAAAASQGGSAEPVDITYTTSSVLDVTQQNFSFTSQSIGDADSTRIVAIIINVYGSGEGPANMVIAGATINSVACTFRARARSASGNASGLEIWDAPVPTGTSVTITVDTSHTVNSVDIGVYRIVNGQFNGKNTIETSGTNAASMPLSISKDGGAIGACWQESASATWTWAGLTEDYDRSMAGETNRTFSGAHAEFDSQQWARPITATPSASTAGTAGISVGYAPIITGGVTIDFRGSHGLTAATGTVKTYSNCDIGAASSDRIILVSSGTTGGGGSVTDISSVTVGGTTLTEQFLYVGSDNQCIAFHAGSVTSGTIENIVVTYNSNASRSGIGVWDCRNLGSVISTDSAGFIYTDDGRTGVAHLSCTAGGLLAASSFAGDANEIRFLYKGLNVDYNNNVNYGGDQSGATLVVSNDDATLGSNSYDNQSGKGDRRDWMTVTRAGGSYSGTSSTMIDGTTGSGDAGISGFATDQTITFDFGSGAAKNITEMKIYFQSSGGNVGSSWQPEGSNDNSSYTSLGSVLNMSSTSTGGQTFAFDGIGETDVYRYYRIRNTNGSGANSVQWWEVEFKIASSKYTIEARPVNDHADFATVIFVSFGAS
tara:strand:- start:6893 stop:8716 length:1824 start_codon:yes stop_codon:yes gene_type:complete